MPKAHLAKPIPRGPGVEPYRVVDSGENRLTQLRIVSDDESQHARKAPKHLGHLGPLDTPATQTATRTIFRRNPRRLTASLPHPRYCACLTATSRSGEANRRTCPISLTATSRSGEANQRSCPIVAGWSIEVSVGAR